MSYKEEIEDLEERLSLYRRNIGRNNARDALLTQKIKRMEEQLELFKKAKAFDEVLKSFDESISEGHMADDVCNIVNKFRSESND